VDLTKNYVSVERISNMKALIYAHGIYYGGPLGHT